MKLTMMTLVLMLGTLMNAKAGTNTCTAQLTTGENLDIIFVSRRVCPRCMDSVDNFSSTAKITSGDISQSYYLYEREVTDFPKIKSVYKKFTSAETYEGLPETFKVISGSPLKIEYKEEVVELICQ